MQSFENYIKMGFTVLATVLTTIFGGWDTALLAIIIFVIADYITGVIKAIWTKKLSSEIGRKGIVKKVMLFVVVALAAQLDRLMGPEAQVLRTAVIYFYVANEGLSILENLTAMGVPFPKQLTERLLQLRGDDKK